MIIISNISHGRIDERAIKSPFRSLNWSMIHTLCDHSCPYPIDHGVPVDVINIANSTSGTGGRLPVASINTIRFANDPRRVSIRDSADYRCQRPSEIAVAPLKVSQFRDECVAVSEPD